MIVRLGTAPRRDGLGFEEFQRHWRTSHADVVSELPGLRRYQQFHALLAEGVPLLPYPGFDACSALRFDSIEDMDAAFASQKFLANVQDDEAEFVDKTRFRGVIGEWLPDQEAEFGDLGTVELLTWWSSEPGTPAKELAAALTDVEGAESGGALVADAQAHSGRFPMAADVVRASGHPDVATALEAAAQAKRAKVPAHVIGEHLARVVDVSVNARDAKEGTA